MVMSVDDAVGTLERDSETITTVVEHLGLSTVALTTIGALTPLTLDKFRRKNSGIPPFDPHLEGIILERQTLMLSQRQNTESILMCVYSSLVHFSPHFLSFLFKYMVKLSILNKSLFRFVFLTPSILRSPPLSQQRNK